MSPATRFSLLFGAQFFALGAAMPFVPVALAQGGLSADWVGIALAFGTAARVLAGLASARVAEMIGLRIVLVFSCVAAGVTLPGMALVEGVALLIIVYLAHSIAIAPVVPLSDAAAVNEMRLHTFDYGRVRAWGSLGFIAAALISGQIVERWGPPAALSLAAAALLIAGLSACSVSTVPEKPRTLPRVSLLAPIWQPGFTRILICSGLIQSSHAVYYGFSALHWSAAGLSSFQIGMLWAWGVLAEVLLFHFGQSLANRAGVRGLVIVAASCGMVRWSITGSTEIMVILFATQTLHAGTFGAMHLAAIRAMVALPVQMGAQAQSLHSALGVGLASGLVMLISGPAYAALGAKAFLLMAGLCLLALLAGLRLKAR